MFLNKRQIEQFNEEGYLLVEGLLDSQEVLQSIIKEYHFVLDDLAKKLFNEGKITSLYENLEFGERLIQIYKESKNIHVKFFNISLPQKNVNTETPIWTGPEVFRLLTNESLLDAVESLIGPEIYSNPTQHVRLVPPEDCIPINKNNGQIMLPTTPWHQDAGVLMPIADNTNIIGAWISIWDAPIEAGCLKIVPKSHLNGLLVHKPSNSGLRLDDKVFEIEKAVPVPTKSGDVIFINKFTCHSSLPNYSNNIRWSFDIRYNPIGEPTGREFFPGFVARSKEIPLNELRNPEKWADSWREARLRLSKYPLQGPYNRFVD